MRDFIARYVAVNRAQASPTFLYGESYGGPRAAVLAHLMLAAGMRLDGVVLQSPALDYNWNCGVFAPATVSCEGFLPSYGVTGAWFGLTRPVPTDADAYAEQLRDFADHAVRAGGDRLGAARTPAPATLLEPARRPHRRAARRLDRERRPRSRRPFATACAPASCSAATTRASPRRSAARWRRRAIRRRPLIAAPFAAAARSRFVNELDYSRRPTLRADVERDRCLGLRPRRPRPARHRARSRRGDDAGHPALRILSISGYHDLATPFRQTELDLARIAEPARLALRIYPGGHMTYLDDGSRRRIRDDLGAWLLAPPAAASVTASTAIAARRTATPAAGVPVPATRVASSAPMRAPASAEPALVPSELAQAGDPWVPPALRITPAGPSPEGPALKALVERKLAERRASPYR